MNGEHGLLRHGSRFESFDVPFLPEDRREIVGKDVVFFTLPEAGHQQKTSFDSRTAKRHCFFRARDSKPGSAFSLERSRTGSGVVPVGISFHHATDADAIPHMLPHRAEVLPESVERHFCPVRTGNGWRAVKARRVHSADYSERVAPS